MKKEEDVEEEATIANPPKIFAFFTQNHYHNQTQIANPKSSSIIKPKLQKKKEEREGHLGKTAARLVRVFKQQFSAFLKIHVGKKVCEKACENMCNIV